MAANGARVSAHAEPVSESQAAAPPSATWAIAWHRQRSQIRAAYDWLGLGDGRPNRQQNTPEFDSRFRTITPSTDFQMTGHAASLHLHFNCFVGLSF